MTRRSTQKHNPRPLERRVGRGQDGAKAFDLGTVASPMRPFSSGTTQSQGADFSIDRLQFMSINVAPAKSVHSPGQTEFDYLA